MLQKACHIDRDPGSVVLNGTVPCVTVPHDICIFAVCDDNGLVVVEAKQSYL
jgi:hypothetical protein